MNNFMQLKPLESYQVGEVGGYFNPESAIQTEGAHQLMDTNLPDDPTRLWQMQENLFNNTHNTINKNGANTFYEENTKFSTKNLRSNLFGATEAENDIIGSLSSIEQQNEDMIM